MSDIRAGLLIGYGSIGRRHAQAIRRVIGTPIIVDSKEAARAQAATDFPGGRIVSQLEELDGDGVCWGNTLPVIATWGPSHADLFKSLVKRGVRRMVCEKPLASSIADASQVVAVARREGIALAVNHYFRYAGFVTALREFASKEKLGQPELVVVEGGAACLVTNGVHCIDFASELYGATPVRVLSTAKGEQINPRSPDLNYFGGSVIWQFADGREMLMALCNRSSVALAIRVYYRDAVVELDLSLQITIRRRDPEAIARFPSVTRTGPASQVLFQGILPGVLNLEDRMDLLLKELVAGKTVTCSGTAGLDSVSACIGALAASREGCAIDLPIAPDSSWGQESWPIS